MIPFSLKSPNLNLRNRCANDPPQLTQKCLSTFQLCTQLYPRHGGKKQKIQNMWCLLVMLKKLPPDYLSSAATHTPDPGSLCSSCIDLVLLPATTSFLTSEATHSTVYGWFLCPFPPAASQLPSLLITYLSGLSTNITQKCFSLLPRQGRVLLLQCVYLTLYFFLQALSQLQGN